MLGSNSTALYKNSRWCGLRMHVLYREGAQNTMGIGPRQDCGCSSEKPRRGLNMQATIEMIFGNVACVVAKVVDTRHPSIRFYT